MIVESLRNQGFAVAIFTPEELGGVSTKYVEDGMVSAGNDIISMFSP